MLGSLLRPREERAVSFQTIFASGGNLAQQTYAGTVITYDTSLKIGAVYACVRLLADTISTLPVDTFYREGGSRLVFRPKPIWVETPDIGMAREDFLQQAMVSLLLDGNVFIRIFRGRSGEVTSLTVLDPTRVEVRRNPATREVEYAIDGTAGAVLTAAEVLHITELRRPGALRGVSRIEEVKQALGLASALEEFSARFFGQGSTTQGLIEWPGNLTREQAKDLADGFEEGHKGLRRAHRPGVLFGGAKFVKTGVDPNEAQMLESRQFAVEEIARIFRCPLHLLQVSTPGAMSYASGGAERDPVRAVHVAADHLEVRDGVVDVAAGSGVREVQLGRDPAGRYPDTVRGVLDGAAVGFFVHRRHQKIRGLSSRRWRRSVPGSARERQPRGREHRRNRSQDSDVDAVDHGGVRSCRGVESARYASDHAHGDSGDVAAVGGVD
jgi:HK97 family phage portal protein